MPFDGKNEVSRNVRIGYVVLVLFAGIVSWQVFLPPVVGNANNGDFGKLIGAFDLAAPQDADSVARFAYVNYAFDPKFDYRPGFYSSESLLVFAAVELNRIFSKPGLFDIRVMGAVGAALLFGAFWLLLPVLRSAGRDLRIPLLVLIAAMFTDVMYVSYLNSFYMDTAGLLFGLLAIVFFLRGLRGKRAADRWLLVLALVLMITSKTQHFPLAVPAALLFTWCGHLLTTSKSRPYVTTAIILVVLAAAFSARSAPSAYAKLACYTVIFHQVLPQSPNVERDLAELGLEQSDARYIGTHAYSADAGMRNPEFTDRFTRRISYANLAWFFAKHPMRALWASEARLAEAGRQRPDRGNFDPSAGRPPFAQSKSFALWSGFKASVFEYRGGRYFACTLLLLFAAVVLALAQRRVLPPGIPEGVYALSAMLLLELIVCSLADALDAPRHFLLFYALSDVLLIALVCLALRGARTLAHRAGAPAARV